MLEDPMRPFLISILLMTTACAGDPLAPSDDTDTDTERTCPVPGVEDDHYCMSWCPSVPDVQDCADGYDLAAEAGFQPGRMDCLRGSTYHSRRYIGRGDYEWTDPYADGYLTAYDIAYADGWKDAGCT